MGTRRSKHNKGRKPRYKDYRDGKPPSKMGFLSANVAGAQSDVEPRSKTSTGHPGRDEVCIRTPDERANGRGNLPVCTGDIPPTQLPNRQRHSYTDAPKNTGIRASGLHPIRAEGTLAAVETRDGADNASSPNSADSPKGEAGRGSTGARPNQGRGHSNSRDDVSRGCDSGRYSGLFENPKNRSRAPTGPLVNPLNDAEARKFQKRLRTIMISYYRPLGPLVWDEMVAKAMMVAIEKAAVGEFHTASWWGKHIIYRTLDGIEENARFVWVDEGFTNNDGEESSKLLDYFGYSPPKQEDVCFIKEIMEKILKLPLKNQGALLRRMGGADVFEIAREMSLDPKEILRLLSDGREWLDRV